MKNEVFLDFCIWEFEDVTVDDITKMLNIQPIQVYKKGEKINPNFSLVAKKNGWRMSSNLDKHSSFQDHMNALIDIIESKLDVFELFCKKYYCEFACAIYIYYDNDESTPWVHLNSRYNELIKKMNVEFDLDLYCRSSRES
ncbi:MAG TPA: DUF4279 domain-containing protein [Chitinophagaceae bacterium]|nr:DUF4279 domain-containing protein [Chitinophagaceae bacterium]